MKKRIFLSSVFLFLLLNISFGQKKQDELLSREIMEKIGKEVSGKICFEHIRDLTVFCKYYGSDAMEKAAAQIKDKAKKYGLSDAYIERFKVDVNTNYWMKKPRLAWNCDFGELRMVKPYRELIASYEANCPSVLACSRDTEVKAEVVYVGKGTEVRDYEGKDVKGKIVLAYGRPWDVSKIAIFQMGAAGILWGQRLDQPGFSSTTVYQTRIQPWNEDKTQFSTFGFSLSADQSRSLMNLIESGEKVILQAKVKAEVRVPGYHQGVVATIPGSTYPDEEIILTAHLDHPRPGAHDNNSGCSTLLEVARVINTLVEQKAIEAPKRTIRFYWNPHIWGCEMFFSSHPELLSTTIANINVDCVGLDQTKVSSALTVVLPPHSRASFLSGIFNNILNYLTICNNDQWGRMKYGPEIRDHDGSANVCYGRTIPFLGYSDHAFFNSGNVGIPAVMLIDLPFGSHHSQNDKIELLDPTQLKRFSFLAAAVAYTIASTGPEDSSRIIDEIYHRGKSRLEMEMKLAKSILRNTRKEDVAQYYKSTKNLIVHAFKREMQALNSTKIFVKEDKEASLSLDKALKKLRRFENECLTDIQEFYQGRCAKLKVKLEIPSLSKEELKLKGIVPVPNSDLKGTFDILAYYDDEKGQSQIIHSNIPFYYELLNLMDGRRNMLDIFRAVQAEALSANYQTFSFKETMRFLNLLKEANIISY